MKKSLLGKDANEGDFYSPRKTTAFAAASTREKAAPKIVGEETIATLVPRKV